MRYTALALLSCLFLASCALDSPYQSLWYTAAKPPKTSGDIRNDEWVCDRYARGCDWSPGAPFQSCLTRPFREDLYFACMTLKNYTLVPRGDPQAARCVSPECIKLQE